MGDRWTWDATRKSVTWRGTTYATRPDPHGFAGLVQFRCRECSRWYNVSDDLALRDMIEAHQGYHRDFADVLAEAEDIYDGWYARDGRVDSWEDFLDRLERRTGWDFGPQMDGVEIRRVRRHIAAYRKAGG